MTSTEYREAYCWMLGTKSGRKDNFEDMIAQKINGTFDEEENQRKIQEFLEKECMPTKQQINRQKLLSQPQQVKTQEETQKPKSYGRRSLISSRLSNKGKSLRAPKKVPEHLISKQKNDDCSNFYNYGNGNSKRENPEYLYTTYNVTANEGINPNTLIRIQGQKVAKENYGRTPDLNAIPETRVVIHRPEFFNSINEAPSEIRDDLVGPFWVSCPAGEIPKGYSLLKKVVRQ